MNMLGCRQVGKAPDSGSGISWVRVLPSQPIFFLYVGMLGYSQVGKAPDFDSGIS